jgi:hypothetical protein
MKPLPPAVGFGTGSTHLPCSRNLLTQLQRFWAPLRVVLLSLHSSWSPLEYAPSAIS